MKHLSEIAQNPQNDFFKIIAQLPCMQQLSSLSSPFGGSPEGEGGLRGIEGEVANWLDNQDVMQALHISPRTLQTLRSNGILPFSRIGNKIYYRKQDILKILSDNYTMYKIRASESKTELVQVLPSAAELEQVKIKDYERDK